MSYLDKSALRLVGTRPIRPDGVDKVTGRANFGADMTMPGMLWGRIKRSPHAHARIVSINTDKALALPGVKAIITRADFADVPPEREPIPEVLVLEAKSSITLRVGEGSITIREDGKILIKGKDLVSHAQRMNRIKGGAVSIN